MNCAHDDNAINVRRTALLWLLRPSVRLSVTFISSYKAYSLSVTNNTVYSTTLPCYFSSKILLVVICVLFYVA